MWRVKNGRNILVLSRLMMFARGGDVSEVEDRRTENINVERISV